MHDDKNEEGVEEIQQLYEQIQTGEVGAISADRPRHCGDQNIALKGWELKELNSLESC